MSRREGRWSKRMGQKVREEKETEKNSQGPPLEHGAQQWALVGKWEKEPGLKGCLDGKPRAMPPICNRSFFGRPRQVDCEFECSLDKLSRQ